MRSTLAILGSVPALGLPLTAGSGEWYAQILGKEPLIRHKGGKWSRWTIGRSSATPIRGSKSIG
jgi:hypothetical protein